jgi:hypothetical protein
MIVICVDKTSLSKLSLTIGEMYKVIDKMRIPFSPSRPDDSSGPFYKIKCDDGEERWIDEYRFRELTLGEKRDLKLNDLGI